MSKKTFILSRFYLWLTISITLLYFSLTYIGSYTNISNKDVLLISIWIIFISIIQYLVLKYKLLVFYSQKFTLSVFIFSNIYAVNLVFNDALIKQPFKIELFLMLLGLFFAYTLLNILNDYRKLQKPIIIFLLSLTTLIMLTPHFSKHVTNINNSEEVTQLKILPISFKQKPNVYIIGVDALVPKSLLKKHLELDQTDLHDLLDKNFITYKNVFSGGDRTVPSYLSMLSLTKEYWFALEEGDPLCRFCPTPLNRNNLMNGLTPSPLIMIFKANGYETSTAHEWPHFGAKKGPYIDNYLLRTRQDGKRISHSICDLISPRSSLIGFFGYCKIRNKFTLLKQYTNTTTEKLHYKGLDFNLAWDLQNIESISSKLKPQLYIGHILSPRHTAYDFDITNNEQLAKFRDFYLERANTTSKLIKIALDNIKKNDSNAIIYIWGDHGPVLSQHLTWDKRNDPASNNKLVRSTKFFIQDRLGSYGGVYHDESICQKSSFQNNRIYSTPQHILKDILFCLSSKESRITNKDYFNNFINDKTFAYPRRTENKAILSDIISYSDYLYE